jgi:hypothetical protein
MKTLEDPEREEVHKVIDRQRALPKEETHEKVGLVSKDCAEVGRCQCNGGETQVWTANLSLLASLIRSTG